MTPEETLSLARAGDLKALGADPAALARAVDAFVAAGDATSAQELVGRAWRAWTSSGQLEDGAAAAARAIDAPDGDGVWRARALYGDGLIAFRRGDDARSRARNKELLDLAGRSGDVRGECDALTGLARLALRAGDYEAVVRLAREARAKARQAGDPGAEASPLHLEAAGVRLQQRYDEARDLYLESLDLNRRLDSPAFVAVEQHNLGWVELHRGLRAVAEEWFRARDAGSVPDAYGDAWRDLNWAAVAFDRGDVDEARRLFESGTRAIDRLGVALDPDDRFEYEWLSSRMAGC